ncbi:MAG: hypothetical protein U0V70_06970 [Terriglobia bacterium]
MAWWNNVETKPYGGYPHFWDQKILAPFQKADPEGQIWDAHQRNESAPYGVFEGKTIFEAVSARNAQEGDTQAISLGEFRARTGVSAADEDWDAPNLYEDTGRRSAEQHQQWGGQELVADTQYLVFPPAADL